MILSLNKYGLSVPNMNPKADLVSHTYDNARDVKTLRTLNLSSILVFGALFHVF